MKGRCANCAALINRRLHCESHHASLETSIPSCVLAGHMTQPKPLRRLPSANEELQEDWLEKSPTKPSLAK